MTEQGSRSSIGAFREKPGRRLLPADARPRSARSEAEEAGLRHAILLREGDHRIKNSLQIVMGLMRLQARRAENSLVSAALLGAAARVEAIARMHDALQGSTGGDSIDLGAVIEVMCRSLQAMAGDERTVAVLVDVESIQAPIAVAQPIVLAVNELVINALHHAFADDRFGTVSVSVAQSNGRLRIVVADDGAGLPAGHADGPGYGMKLVNMMVAQIGGALLVESNPGACFTLTAPVAGQSRQAPSEADATADAPAACMQSC
ncbi:MAG: sensor histidine kinase [Pseudomonadota bacterium]